MADMTTMQMIPAYHFTLDQEQTLLVLKALGGRLKPEEVETARLLGDRLTHERAIALERTAHQLYSALEKRADP
jgi:hypothetical protein